MRALRGDRHAHQRRAGAEPFAPGKTYWGRPYVEHAPTASPEEKAQNLWASLDNAQSFWLTRASLLNALAHAGFTSVFECHVPAEATKPADRITLVACKGAPQALQSAPLLANQPPGEVAE